MRAEVLGSVPCSHTGGTGGCAAPAALLPDQDDGSRRGPPFQQSPSPIPAHPRTPAESEPMARRPGEARHGCQPGSRHCWIPSCAASWRCCRLGAPAGTIDEAWGLPACASPCPASWPTPHDQGRRPDSTAPIPNNQCRLNRDDGSQGPFLFACMAWRKIGASSRGRKGAGGMNT